MEWTIRRLEPGDEPAFLLFLAGWISDRPVGTHYEWLYRGNPHGKALTWIAVLDNVNRIVGCTSVFPRRMMHFGETFMGSFGGDAFVDPEFRRRGIAQSLHEFSIADMKRLDVQCNYGFPVPANFRAFLRAGALDPCDFQHLVVPFRAKPPAVSLPLGPLRPLVQATENASLKLYLKTRVLRRSRLNGPLQESVRFDTEVDRLFESVAHELRLCCIRDADYLNWRFVDNPFVTPTILQWREQGILLAYAVLDLNAGNCGILDLLVRDEEIGRSFLASVAQFALDRNKTSISLKLNASGPYAPLFRRCGWLPTRHTDRLMVQTLGDPERDRIFRNAENWFLMPGDRDVG